MLLIFFDIKCASMVLQRFRGDTLIQGGGDAGVVSPGPQKKVSNVHGLYSREILYESHF